MKVFFNKKSKTVEENQQWVSNLSEVNVYMLVATQTTIYALIEKVGED